MTAVSQSGDPNHFLLFVSLGVIMVIRNRNRVLHHFSNCGTATNANSVLLLQLNLYKTSWTNCQSILYYFSLSWLRRRATFLMFLLSSQHLVDAQNRQGMEGCEETILITIKRWYFTVLRTTSWLVNTR